MLGCSRDKDSMQVFLHHTADKYLDRLSEPYKGQIITALADLEKEPPEGDIRPMAGQPDRFRLKVGNFRALFHIENNSIVVSHIAPRGQAYKKKTRGRK